MKYSPYTNNPFWKKAVQFLLSLILVSAIKCIFTYSPKSHDGVYFIIIQILTFYLFAYPKQNYGGYFF